jgi:hypothetical protein
LRARGRVGDNALLSRAAFVIGQILPELDSVGLVSRLLRPNLIVQGDSSSENLTISEAISNSTNRVSHRVKVAIDTSYAKGRSVDAVLVAKSPANAGLFVFNILTQ